MKADIISIGDEYLTGTLEEKNASYLAGRLSELNVEIRRRVVIGNDPEELQDVLKNTYDSCELAVISGIAGKENGIRYHQAVADLFSGQCVYSEEVFHYILDYVRKHNLSVSQKQIYDLAVLPGNAMALPNHCGIAPGYILRDEKKTAIVLPTRQKEVQSMFEDDAAGFFFHELSVKKVSMKIELKPLMTGHYSRKNLEEKLGNLMENKNPGVRIAREGEKDLLYINAKGPTCGDAQILADMMVSYCCQRIGEDNIKTISM